MSYAIIVSKKDQAGMNIKEQLGDCGIPIYEFEEESIYLENIDKEIKEDFIIFATKHASVQPNKTLSIHAPGNFKDNDFGGEKSKVCPTSASVMKNFFIELNKQAELAKTDYKITLECTHHGPLISKPCLFIEIGSAEKEWIDKDAGKIIAKTIIKAVKQDKKYNSAIGLGGPHYCPNFNKLQLNSEIAISHVIPSYLMPITQEMIQEAINKTTEKINFAVIDWKGLGKSNERQNVLEILEKIKINYKKTNEFT